MATCAHYDKYVVTTICPAPCRGYPGPGRADAGGFAVLIGEQLPGGLPTPATVVFADRLERNLAGMAALASDAGMALRPHAKTHKCVEIARRQLALGARALSVATVGEAEALTAGGQLDPADVFIAYPVWAEGDIIGRLTRLARRAQVTVGADSAEAVGGLAALAGQVQHHQTHQSLYFSRAPPTGTSTVTSSVSHPASAARLSNAIDRSRSRHIYS